MAFTPKNWQDAPATATPLSAAALEDLETRLSAYTDTAAASVIDLNLQGYPGIDTGGGAGTDSTAGLNNALTQASAAAQAVSATTIARVIFPSKAKIQTDGVLLQSNVHMVGQGATLLKKNNSSGLVTNSLVRTVPVLRSASAAGNGTTTSGDDRVTGLTNVAAIELGRRISGTGIPADAKVKALDGTTLTLTAPATASGTVALTMGQTYYGTFKWLGMEDIVLDRNGKTVLAHMINAPFLEHARFENVTVQNYDIPGVWAFSLGGRDISVIEPLILGGNSVTSDGVHFAHGQDLRLIGGYIESGDDAVAFGANPSTDTYLATDPDSIRRGSVVGTEVRSGKGHAIRIYTEPSTSGPNQEVTDIDAQLVGRAGILRNGGLLIEDGDHPAAGLSQVRDINVKLRAEVGSTSHDDTNPYAVHVYSGDRVKLDVDLTGVTQGATAVNGFITGYFHNSADVTVDLRCEAIGRRWGILAQDCPRFTVGGNTRLRQSAISVTAAIDLQNCPGFKLQPGVRVLDVQDGFPGISVGTGTTSEGDIIGATVEHEAGATSGASISVAGSAYTGLRLIGNRVQRAATTGSMLASKTMIVGNDGIADNLLALPALLEQFHGRHIIPAATAAATFALGPYGGGALSGSLGTSSAFRLDPADYALNGRTAKLRLGGRVITNAVAPASNFTFSLLPIATWGGASGANPTIATTGASLGIAVITAPGANAATETESAEFAFPAAGYYTLAVQTSAVIATGAHCTVLAQLKLTYD